MLKKESKKVLLVVNKVDDGWKFVRWGQHETSGTFEAHGEENLAPVEYIRLAVEQMGRVREAMRPDIQICLDFHTRLYRAPLCPMT